MRYFGTDSVYTIHYFKSNNACINNTLNGIGNVILNISIQLQIIFYILFFIFFTRFTQTFCLHLRGFVWCFFAKQIIFFSWKLAVNNFCDACYISKYLFCVPYCFKCICWSMYAFMYWCAYMCISMCVYIITCVNYNKV